VSVVTEAAKADAMPDNLLVALEEAGLGSGSAKKLTAIFECRREELRFNLRRTGLTGLRHLVDVEWRLDYHIRSSGTGVENVPVYLVALQTKGADGSIESQKLTLSQEQMLDFLATVKDANKQIDRILTLN